MCLVFIAGAGSLVLNKLTKTGRGRALSSSLSRKNTIFFSHEEFRIEKKIHVENLTMKERARLWAAYECVCVCANPVKFAMGYAPFDVIPLCKKSEDFKK